ncbi:hypothetical protein KDA11_01180 [Candidatus Saccharibacteria bacterium]|nr:hypothetical protein [Candidatus Saccharibacteria bacterium]
MTNIYANRRAVQAAQSKKKPYVVLVPRRYELVHDELNTAIARQTAAVVAARQKDIVQLTKLLEGCNVTTAEFLAFTNDPNCTQINIVPLHNTVFDSNRWMIDFIAFPNCNWRKLEAQGAL